MLQINGEGHWDRPIDIHHCRTVGAHRGNPSRRFYGAEYGVPNTYHVAMGEITVDRDRLREVCERFGVARLEVFGSVSRGEAGPASDIDLLYELKAGTRLGFRIFDLEDELTEIFHRPVDLVGRDSINRYLREQVLHDARPVYAA